MSDIRAILLRSAKHARRISQQLSVYPFCLKLFVYRLKSIRHLGSAYRAIETIESSQTYLLEYALPVPEEWP